MRVVQVRVSRIQSRLMLGHCFGGITAIDARRHGVVLLLPGALQNKFENSGYGFHLRRTLRKCRTSALGVGPTR